MMADEPAHTTRRNAKKARLVAAPTETAGQAIGRLEPGFRLFGITKGQFSLIDLIRAVLAQTGPADVTISTWTAGIRDVENIDFLIKRGNIRSLRLLVDRSFPGRQPKYCARVLDLFGEDAIRCTRTHAKFAMLRNDDWSITIRSSMNLNRNPRFEQFDIDDDVDLYDFLTTHVEEMIKLMPPGVTRETEKVDDVFQLSLGGGLSDAYPSDSDGMQALLDKLRG